MYVLCVVNIMLFYSFSVKKKDIMLLYTIFKIIIRVNYNLLIYGLTEI